MGRWAGRIASGLLAAMAIAGPGCAVASASGSASARAVAYLQRAQNSDGGLGAAPGQASDQLFAGWAALGLASAGVDLETMEARPGDPSLLAYVRRGAGARDTGSLERTILVLRAAGAPAVSVDGHDLVRELVARFGTDGAISRQVNLTAFGLLALRAAGVASTTRLQVRAAAWLAGQADRDGGYGYAGRGSGSDADDTGAVLEALGPDGRGVVARARRGAVGFLRRAQDRDGGFPAAPGAGSNAQSTAWAVQGLEAAGVSVATVRRDGATPLAYLRGLTSASGAIRYARGISQTPVWVTGEALMALTGTPLV